MPTNVPPQYKEAEARFRAAGTTEEKIAALEEMLRIIPKHKGTDKLQADLKTRLAKLRKQPGKKTGGKGHSHMIPREGAGQIVLVGAPNSGKSSLVARATHATPRIAEYPFTTIQAVPGMMPFEDATFQLIDMPPISEEHVEPWVFDLVRRADIVWLVVDGTAALDGFDQTRALLEEKHISLYPVGTPEPEAESLSHFMKATVLVVTRADLAGVREDLPVLKDLLEDPWPVMAVSGVNGEGLDDLARLTFETLDVIRIYTKEPGRPPDEKKPFTLKRGATVADLASTIHKDLATEFKFAKVWGTAVFDGQRVKADHVLEDKDVVEIHV